MIEIFAIVVLICFLVPAYFGAPYVPTLKAYIPTAFDLLDLKHGQTLLELGCGDGRIVLAAAQRGYKVIGYELNPILVLVARLRTLRYRKQVKIVWGNFFKQELPPADGIFCFIMPSFMDAIDKKIADSQLGPIRLVSFSMPIPKKQLHKQRNHILLYTYE